VNPFGSLNNRIEQWLQHGQGEMFIRGISPSAWSFMYSASVHKLFASRRKLVVAASPEEAERLWEELKNQPNALFYPGLGHSPYTSILSSESALMQRFRVLSLLTHDPSPWLVVTSIDAALLYMPPKEFFKDHALELKVDDIIAPYSLAEKLVSLGYRATPSVEEPGTFTRKGEIFDIYPLSDRPVRLHYFDDLIESILVMDPETQKSLSDTKLDRLLLSPAPGIFTREEFHSRLRENLPQPQPQFKTRYDIRKGIFQQLAQGLLFENYPVYTPLFFANPTPLAAFFDQQTIVTEIARNNALQEWDTALAQWKDEFEAEADRNDSPVVLPAPDKIAAEIFVHKSSRVLVVETLDITVDLDSKIKNDLHGNKIAYLRYKNNKEKQKNKMKNNRINYDYVSYMFWSSFLFAKSFR
jgi:transcription-repair coupling factor (superfamily II helicase)